MIDVKLCAINSKYSHSSLAVWYLKAAVLKFSDMDINCQIVEGTINESEDILYERIADNVKIFAFSCYIWNIEIVKSVAKRLKNQFPNAKIIFGGPEVSYNADEILQKLDFVDFVISGEGERPFARLIEVIANEEKIPKNLGICYRDDAEIVISEPFISGEIPPDPYSEEYFSTLNGRIAYVESTRGCPFSCAFCLSGRCTKVINFDTTALEEQLIKLSNSSTRTIKFVDRTFNANKARSKKILRFILDNYGGKIRDDVCFHIEAAGDILDDETIEIISKMPEGALQIEIGMQSFNEETLSYINRKTNTKKLIENIKKLTSCGNVHLHVDLIIGLPFEDFSSFRDSFNTAFSLGADMLQVGFLKLLYGADMREDGEKFPCKFSGTPPYEVKSTPWLTEKEVLELKNLEDAVDRLYNSGRFIRTVDFILESTGITAFELFYSFGNYVATLGTYKISLDEYTSAVLEFFGAMENIDKSALRDVMVCDRFSVNSFGALPKCLQIHDPKTVSSALAYLELSPETARKKSVKRSIAILYSRSKSDKIAAVFADYDTNSKNYHGISAPNYKITEFFF